MNVAAYVRLSVATEESVSVAGQVRLVQAEASRRGWPVPTIFTDENVSGSKAVARPARDDLERRMGAGEFDAVLVKSVDRLARSVLDFHRLAATAAKRGCALVIIEAGLDTSTPHGKMMLGILAEFAAFEAATIGLRVTTSNVGLRREGRTRGGPVPYGLRNVRREDRPGMFREIDLDEAAVVRRMADLILAGHSLRGIADQLNADDVPTPRARDAALAGRAAAPLPWSYTAVRRILTNPAIAGMEVALGDVVRDDDGLSRVDDSAAILDAATFRAVRAAVQQRGAGIVRRTPHAARPLLDALVFCSACGGTMRRVSTRGYISYGCSNASKGKCITRTTIAAKTLDGYVTASFLTAYGDTPTTRWEITEATHVSPRLAQIRAEILDTAAAFATSPSSTLADLAARMTALRDAEERLLAEAHASPVYAAVSTGRTYTQEWQAAPDVVTRRALLSDAIARVVVTKGRGAVADRVAVDWGSEDYADVGAGGWEEHHSEIEAGGWEEAYVHPPTVTGVEWAMRELRPREG